MTVEQPPKGLPSNAFTELKEGEKYIPIVPAEEKTPEITFYSVTLGLLMCILFSAACAYLGLKLGQVFEAAIPIAIMAVGITAILGKSGKKKTILENVIVQSIGAASGVVVAGAIFTIPAIFILGLEDVLAPTFSERLIKISLVALLGGALGILFLIPFRKFFVSEMHGMFPFPEATATTGVLVAGEAGGEQAKVLTISMIIGGIYDFLIQSVQLFHEIFDTRIFAFGKSIANEARVIFQLNIGAAVSGMGYIIGLKYGSIICAGSFLTSFLIVPLIYFIGQNMPTVLPLPPIDSGILIADMSFEEIFKNYARPIGIGGIACAGIIGIIKSSKIIVQAFGMGFKELFKKHESASHDRTSKDISMKTVIIGIFIVSILLFLVFRFLLLDPGSLGVLSDSVNSTWVSLVAFIIVLVISFLFTTVAARAIAIVGSNPVSGMTLMTLIISSFILVLTGLKGEVGMVAALMVGGVVCTALSMAGGFITDLKIGYWIGSTPTNQEKFKFLGTFVSAISVGFVIIMLNNTYGFSNADVMPAPQANAMAAVMTSFLGTSEVMQVPWMLYIIGIFVALTMELIGVPPLAFALGMYLPLHLNTPMLIGGLIAHIVKKSSKDEEISHKRYEKGTLIASGFIAGVCNYGCYRCSIKVFRNLLFRYWFSGSTDWPWIKFNNVPLTSNILVL